MKLPNGLNRIFAPSENDNTLRSHWLTKQEIDDLCRPLRQKAAQVSFLTFLGLNVKRKPDGSPLVMRSNVEMVLGSNNHGVQKVHEKTQPNRDGLLLKYLKKKV